MLKGRFYALLLSFFSIFASEIEIEVPLFFNSQIIKNVSVFVDLEHDLIRIEDKELLSTCRSLLTKDGLEKLYDFTHYLGYIPENTPKKNKYFSIYFSTINQGLYIEASLELLSTRFHDVTKKNVREGIKGGTIIEPKDFSGYINLEGGIKNRQNYMQKYNPVGLSSFGNFNGNIHYKDTNLQGYGYFLSNNTIGINPVSIVLSKEFLKNGVKCSIGTLSSYGISFQGTSPLLGINFSKNSDLIVDPVIGSMSRHDIFLNAQSEIRIIINGVDVNRLDLPAGSHVLQNFPLADGLNNVKLHITGPTGDVREVDLSVFYNVSLLKVGESQCNLSVGFPAYDISKGPSGFYDMSSMLALTGYFKRGVLDYLTLGGYLQYYEKTLFSGMQGMFSKYYFKSVAELGLSYSIKEVPYFRSRVAISQPDAWKYPVTWNLVMEGQQGNFKFFGGSTDTVEPMQFLGSASLGMQVQGSISLNILGQYGYYRDVGNKYILQGTITAMPTKWFTIRAIGSYQESSRDKGRFDTAINFDISPNYKDLTTKVRYNSKQRALTASVGYTKALPGRRSIATTGGYNLAPNAHQVEGSVVYKGTYGSFRASQQLMKNSFINVDSTVAVTDVNLGTAAVFAGKNIAISRPLHDSFFIIAPNKHLRHSPVVANPVSDDYIAQASYYFPSVVSLASYSGMNVALLKKDGGYGGDFEDTMFYMKSLKNSGSVLEVGDTPKYVVEGIFYLDGEVADGVSGMMISDFLEEGKVLKHRFFSDEEGSFQIIGVVPGSYTIKFRQKGLIKIANVEISPDDDELNYIFLGDFYIEKEVIKKYKEILNEK